MSIQHEVCISAHPTKEKFQMHVPYKILSLGFFATDSYSEEI